MNEIIEALLLYHLLIFSDWYTHDDMKESLGYSFNAVIFTNISIHLIFLFYTVFIEIRSKIRTKQCICQRKTNRVN